MKTALLLSALILTSCAYTKVTAKTKDPAFSARSMRKVLVIAVVRKPKTQQLLENEFVARLAKRDAQAIASYTITREGEKMDRAAWEKIVADNQFDAVIVSRLMDYKVEAGKEGDPKIVVGRGASYGYYEAGYYAVYQPGFDTRKETAAIETRVFDAAGDKQVWSAHSKTDIEYGRDPEAQVRDFVGQMMDEIYK